MYFLKITLLRYTRTSQQPCLVPCEELNVVRCFTSFQEDLIMTHMRTILTAVNLKRHIMKLKLQLLRLPDTCPAKCVRGRLSIIYLRGISSRRSKKT